MDTTHTRAWSDTMPVLSLGKEGGVPYRVSGRLVFSSPVPEGLAHIEPERGQPALDHHAGFGWSLRWFYENQTCPPMDGRVIVGMCWERIWMAILGNNWFGMVIRHAMGVTTDADRDTLAQACASVCRAIQETE